MKASEKHIIKKAQELGITTDELLEEMEVGSPDKPFTIAVRFDRLSQMKEFANALGYIGVGIYRADALDPEYGGVPRQNSFVLRTVAGGNKPEEWRVG